MDENKADLRRVVRFVAFLNLLYFGIEFAVARAIGSVSLFADSVDFLEDTSVNLLIAVALTWPAKWRARTGMALAAIILVPAIALIWTAWQKFHSPLAPNAPILSITGLGALGVNSTCALILASVRHNGGSLTKAAFLSARNDAFANIAIVGAGIVTVFWRTAWPDLIVGLGIAAMNVGAAKEVMEAAIGEHGEPEAKPET